MKMLNSPNNVVIANEDAFRQFYGSFMSLLGSKLRTLSNNHSYVVNLLFGRILNASVPK